MSSYLFPLLYSLYTSPLGWYLNHYLLNPTPSPDQPQHSLIDPDTNILTLYPVPSGGHSRGGRRTITVTPIPYGKDNYAYAIHDATTRQALVIDAGDGPSVLNWCADNGVEHVTHVLSTHRHHDHTGGNHLLVRRWPAIEVVGGLGEGVACVTREAHPGDTLAGLLDGCVQVETLAAPGHTRHSVMYLVVVRGTDAAMLFSGDTLFRAGVGKFFELGAPNMLGVLDTLAERTRAWPKDTWLFPGHEYALANLHFAARVMPDNAAVTADLAHVRALRRRRQCTVPTLLSREWETNPFCRTRGDLVGLTWSVREMTMSEEERQALEGVQWGPEGVLDGLRRARDMFEPPEEEEEEEEKEKEKEEE